ncbi:MAG: hypothetical protein GXO37_04760 [Chloroflexi bacterium]|nr:hypothetical protein [Chloroflexota bacterium]
MPAQPSARTSPSALARGAAWLMAALAAAALAKHALRLRMVVRLVRSGVLDAWPWRVPWPWVAGTSALVLLIGLPWLLAFVSGAAWARREAGRLGGLYFLGTLLERLFWTPTRPDGGQMLFAAWLTAAEMGLWLALARLAAPGRPATSLVPHRSKEAS